MEKNKNLITSVQVGSWVLYYDSYSKEKVMVKVISKNDINRTAIVSLNLAVRKGELPQQYQMEVSYDELRKPRLKIKKQRAVK